MPTEQRLRLNNRKVAAIDSSGPDYGKGITQRCRAGEMTLPPSLPTDVQREEARSL